MKRYRDAGFGWTITYGSGFRLREVGQSGPNEGQGIEISNAKRLSDRLVAFRFLHHEDVDVLPIARLISIEQAFPLKLRDFRSRTRSTGNITARRLILFANGFLFEAAVLVGKHAASEDKRDLDEIVQSLRFPKLSEGSVAGEGFFVLGDVPSYTRGSTTRYDIDELPVASNAQRRPFYLVHARNGFYALSWGFGADPEAECEIQAIYAPALEFVCGDMRWDRMGRPIADKHPRAEPLQILATHISHDRHVLVSPNIRTSGLTATAIERRLWGRR